MGPKGVYIREVPLYIINLLCFSTAVLLLFAADFNDMIFLLFDDLSKTVIVCPH